MVVRNCCPFSFSFPPVPRTSASERPACKEIGQGQPARCMYVLHQCSASHADRLWIAAGCRLALKTVEVAGLVLQWSA